MPYNSEYLSAYNGRIGFGPKFGVYEPVVRFAGRKLAKSLAAYKIGNFIHNKLKSHKVGGSKRPLPNKPMLRGTKVQKMDVDESQSTTLTDATSAQCSVALDQLAAGTDIVANKRLPQYRFRLHKAVYLKMDPLLRKLLFPVTNLQLAFGFKSVSDNPFFNQNQDIDGHLGSSVSASTTLKDTMPRGVWRGFACMVIRGFRRGASRISENALNTQFTNVGAVSYPGITGYNGIKSYYKLFANGPRLSGDGTANEVSNLGEYPLTCAEQLVATTNTIPGYTPMRYLHLGENLSTIEQYAAYSTRFISPTMNQVGTSAALSDSIIGPGQSIIDPASAFANYGLYVDNNNGTGAQYNLNARYCIQRICDGMVELDIMNTFQTCCVLEVVLIATKRDCQNVQQLCNAITYDYALRHKQEPPVLKQQAGGATHAINPVPGIPESQNRATHGWETWYDPETPFVKTTSKDKRFNAIATEIHRSNHVLAPGQSKRVTVYLGNLYYRLTERAIPSLAVQSGNDAPELGLGSIVAFVGHTGFDAPQSFTGWSASLGNDSNATAAFGTTVPDPLPGNIAANTLGHGIGQFVGRTKTPSSILCEGKYHEKFYPIISESDGRTFGNYKVGNVGAYVQSSDDRYGFNHDQFVPQKVQTVDAGTISVTGASAA